jgi:hypothetical protein
MYYTLAGPSLQCVNDQANNHANKPMNKTHASKRRNNYNIWEYFHSTEQHKYYTTHLHTLHIKNTHPACLRKMCGIPAIVVLPVPLTLACQQQAVSPSPTLLQEIHKQPSHQQTNQGIKKLTLIQT